MSIYYQDDHVTLYHGDCRDVLAGMPNQSVDAVITDPPYTERTHKQAKSNKGKGHGTRQIDFVAISDGDLDVIVAEMGRVTRRWVVASLDYRHAVKYDAAPPPGLRVPRIGVWVKTNPMPSISADRPAQGWEAIAYMHRDDVKPAWNGGGKHGNYVLGTEKGQGHPTAKPIVMVQDFVRRFTNYGDTILDPFAGSGTTLRAAVNEGRKAIGVELDERYCEVIAKRLDQYSLDLGGL